MRVMGIDPGTRIVGYSVVEKNGNRLTCITSGAVRTNTKEPIPKRLRVIHREISQVIEEYEPQHAAVEKVFFGKNIQSAIKLGEGRGVVLLAAAQKDLEIFEYDATKVKKAIVGGGRAHKSQIKFMVQRILNIDKEMGDDESDALAIAVCHCQNYIAGIL
ncbi:crossover junction endodeoxyribonuclease RuvC [Candidatus Uabimicrobium sp. HlEnr_7]|uniref:crossover junction endodeoxyribonuclease RuvC n=1 Tax=Candidatus Uabimicrobium helgolandensis TaxID=3095367 RepID=UPI003556CA9B